MCVCHVLSLACGQRHASPGGFSYAAGAQDSARLELVSGTVGREWGLQKGEEWDGGLERPARKSLRALCCFINYLFRFCANGRAQGSRSSSSSSRRQAHAHTHRIHTLPSTHIYTHIHTICNTHLDKLELDVLGILFWVCRLRDQSETHI